LPATLADAHIHLFNPAGQSDASPQAGDDLTHYEALRRDHRIERALVVGFEGESRFAGNNRNILGLAATHQWARPLVYLSSLSAPSSREITEWRTKGAVGFSVYATTEAHARAIPRWPAETLEAMSTQRLILSINAPPEAIAVISEVLDQLSGCRVLISHLGLPGQYDSVPTHAAAAERLGPLLGLARSTNALVKFSGLYAISDPARDRFGAITQPFVDLALETFGPDRLVWGSDFPPVLNHMSFERTLDTAPLAKCTSAEISRIMGENLMQLLDSPTEGN
jgi:L-fuconolactonase